MSETNLEKDSQDGIPEGLSPEEAERLRGFKQAHGFHPSPDPGLFKNGVLYSRAPGIEKAKEGLYQQFKLLFDQEDELTFLSREEEDRQEILVEGVLPEPQILDG